MAADRLLHGGPVLSRRALVGGAALSAAVYAAHNGPHPAVAQDGGAEMHIAWPYLDPGSGGHFNHFVTNGIMNPPNIYGDLMFVPMALQYWADWSWLPLMATEWSFQSSRATVASPIANQADSSPASSGDVDTFLVSLRQGVAWSDGTPVTATDVLATFNCLWLLSNTVWTYIDAVTAIDDATVSFHMSTPSTTVERYVLRRSILPAAIYGDFGDRAQALRDSGLTAEAPEFLQLLDEFNQYRPDQIIVNGPYTIDIPSITNAQFTMPRNASSFWTPQAKFDRLINFNGETDTISAVVLSKEIDYATHAFAIATEQQMLADGIRVLRPPTYAGLALKFNFAALPEFADKRARQALAKAIDRSQTGFISLAESGVPVSSMAGISDNLVSSWVREDAIAGLNTYALDRDAAATELEALGWSRVDGRWKKPDGSDAAYEVIWAAEHSTGSATGGDIVEQLQEFGFSMVGRPVTHTQVGVDVDKGAFQMAIQGWGSSANPHPRFSFEAAFFSQNYPLAVNNGGRGMDFPLAQVTDVAGEVDLEALVRDCALGMDVAAQVDRVTTIVQVFNELLNIIPIYERYGNTSALEGVRVQSWPPDDDPIHLNSPYADGLPTILLLSGGISPVGS